jgi:hypothetical protein
MAKNAKRLKESPKTRFELRFDADVYDSVNKLADQVGVSLNQLMQGITRWAVEHSNPGEFVGGRVHDENDVPMTTRDQAGVVWFGDQSPVFELDFTERRVVRELTEKTEVKRARK